MDPIIVSPQNQRADFERIVNAVAKAMGQPASYVKANYTISPQTLQLAAVLSNTTGLYQFWPVQAAGPALQAGVPQVQMNKNDWFAVANMGFAFSKCDYVSASATYLNSGNFPKFSYPDPAYFAGAPAGATTEAASLQTVVNGLVSITVQSNPILLATPVRDFVFNPQSTYTASPLAYPQLGGTDVERGLSELTPSIIFDGNADNLITVQLAPGSTTDLDGSISPGTTAATTRNLLWFLAKGWIIKNLADGGRSCDVRV